METIMRINKYIARCGYTSRRKADDLVKNGKVKVNGKLTYELGLDIKDSDIVEIDGEILQIEEKIYIKLYKPRGYITSNFDPYNDRDLNDLVKTDQRFFAAGRLDKDSEGLLIITNDGVFTNQIIHPSKKLDKTYIVRVTRLLNKKDCQRFESGLDIGNSEITSDSRIELIDKASKTYKVTIHQGYKRQIRRMFAQFSSEVTMLKRISIGPIKLDGMEPYEKRNFDQDEMDFVRKTRG